jgi:hypothetical protein
MIVREHIDDALEHKIQTVKRYMNQNSFQIVGFLNFKSPFFLLFFLLQSKPYGFYS